VIARRISAQNLGERIPTAGVPSELLAMATTLNDSLARLDAAFAAQAAFTADASHELRTPLAIVLSHLELAAAPDQTLAQLRERIGVCHAAAKRVQSIVAGLLTLARADADAVAFDRRGLDLGALVDAETEAFAALARQHGITIERCTAAVLVTGDRDRLREVVTNLIDNAIRYNKPGGRITVSVTAEGHAAVLRVADTGIGIAERHRAQVFDRFFRADPARSRAAGGSGLGLAIARWIVERHHGSITVGGQPGEGTEFVVRLPRTGPSR
jgi:signal transduction histidine kinase